MAEDDLIALAVPAFFAAMGAEKLVLDRRAEAGDTSAVGFERNDTLASLAMGVGSLVVPPLVGRLLAPVAPGRGRYGRVLVIGAIGAAAVTTVADVLARRAEQDDVDADDTLSRIARRLRPSAGVAAVASGITAGALAWTARTSARRLWRERGSRHDLGSGVAAYAAAIIGWDFLYYWNHRLQHESRFMWAIHVVHHSSEHYNLSTALRQPVAENFGLFLPFGVMAWLGIRPRIIETARAINLIYQFWIHTEAIERLGPAEEVFNTPSHHRVHHGVQPQYLDRNHGGILIVWDRLFGTFTREGERVRYGLTRNIATFNPLRIATHEHLEILRDVARSTSWRERLGHILANPGWGKEQVAVRGWPDATGRGARRRRRGSAAP